MKDESDRYSFLGEKKEEKEEKKEEKKEKKEARTETRGETTVTPQKKDKKQPAVKEKRDQEQVDLTTYRGKKIQREEVEALKRIERQIGKVPEFTVKNHQVHEIFLANTPMNHLTPLKHFTALKTLDLEGTLVDDLTPLQPLRKLEDLYLAKTDVANIKVLRSLSNLEVVDLEGTSISQENKEVKILQQRDVNVYLSELPPKERLQAPKTSTKQKSKEKTTRKKPQVSEGKLFSLSEESRQKIETGAFLAVVLGLVELMMGTNVLRLIFGQLFSLPHYSLMILSPLIFLPLGWSFAVAGAELKTLTGKLAGGFAFLTGMLHLIYLFALFQKEMLVEGGIFLEIPSFLFPLLGLIFFLQIRNKIGIIGSFLLLLGKSFPLLLGILDSFSMRVMSASILLLRGMGLILTGVALLNHFQVLKKKDFPNIGVLIPFFSGFFFLSTIDSTGIDLLGMAVLAGLTICIGITILFAMADEEATVYGLIIGGIMGYFGAKAVVDASIIFLLPFVIIGFISFLFFLGGTKAYFDQNGGGKALIFVASIMSFPFMPYGVVVGIFGLIALGVLAND